MSTIGPQDGLPDYRKPGYFPFPFTPYDIQEDFMVKLYETLEKGKIGIFESPTGTGKSLSIICGALTWLRDFTKRQREGISASDESLANASAIATSKEEDNEPSWVNEYVESQEKQNKKDNVKKIVGQQERLEQRIKAVKAKADKKRKRAQASETNINEQTLVNTNDGCNREKNVESDDELLLDSDNASDSASSGDEMEEQHTTKIYYCSRTHSQLSQFVHEIQKSPFAGSTKVVSLGSRQNSCINPDVNKLKSLSKINERCLEMQKKKKVSKSKEDAKRRKTGGSCQFHSQRKAAKFPDHLFTEVKDIEQIVQTGKDLSICPYYGSRQAIPYGEVIALPYNTLLHKGTRKAVGIKLEGNVVIIDEAHNLIDSINDVHSCSITGTQISSSKQQLTDYLSKYRSRLKAKKIMLINQLLFVMNAFLQHLHDRKADATPLKTDTPHETMLLTIHEFLSVLKIDNINLFEIRRFCESSLIARKLNGFVDRHSTVVTRGDLQEAEVSMVSQFVHIQAFIEALTNMNDDGRVLVSKHRLLSSCSLKFLLLNPVVHFAEIAKECRAVIAAGGTMQPVDEIRDVLLYGAGVAPSRITEFTCGHIIPDSNLIALGLSRGPTGVELDFSFQHRSDIHLIDELGRLILNVATVVSGGIVCFFASYDYEEKVYNRWSAQGLLQKLDGKKKVFREQRKSSNVDVLLSSYAQAIKASKEAAPANKSHKTGAILLSVVGGKMSEGINFSDDLGRCIIMVGMPYANIMSPELKEKMQYFEKTIREGAGQEHYENICMKAVNQSIGRAIRHRLDYASIMLLDKRYARTSVTNKLPLWIQSRYQTYERFGPAFGAMNKFFADKHKKAEETI